MQPEAQANQEIFYSQQALKLVKILDQRSSNVK